MHAKLRLSPWRFKANILSFLRFVQEVDAVTARRDANSA